MSAFASKVTVDAFASAGGDRRRTLAVVAGQAEMAERFDDMAVFTAELAREVHGRGERLSLEERNMLSVAFKHSIGSRRSAWRSISAAEGDAAVRDAYAARVEEELLAASGEIIGLLESMLIPKAGDGGGNTEEIVFYAKMCGDYHRYVAEVRPEHGKDAVRHYNAALAEAEKLDATNPIRLGLALNLSVCYFEIIGDKAKAISLAKDAFDAAVAGLDKLDEASYQDSTLIMQLLRDNLDLWKDGDGGVDGDGNDLDVEDME